MTRSDDGAGALQHSGFSIQLLISASGQEEGAVVPGEVFALQFVEGARHVRSADPAIRGQEPRSMRYVPPARPNKKPWANPGMGPNMASAGTSFSLSLAVTVAVLPSWMTVRETLSPEWSSRTRTASCRGLMSS